MQIRTTLMVVVTLLLSSKVYCSQSTNLVSRDSLQYLFLYRVSSHHESFKPAPSHTVEVSRDSDVPFVEAFLLDINNFQTYMGKAEAQPFVFPFPSPIITSSDETFLACTIDIMEQYLENPDFPLEVSAQESAGIHPLLFPNINATASQTPNNYVKSLGLKRSV